MSMTEAAVQREQREARTVDGGGGRRPRRMVGGVPLSYLILGAGVVGGFLLYRRSKLAGATGAAPGPATGGPSAFPAQGVVPQAGYGSANPPSPGSLDWGSIISQMGAITGGGGGGGGVPGGIQGVITNQPQVEYGAKDPTHPLSLKDELTGIHRWISKPGGAHIPGGPVGYGAAGGEDNPNVYTTTEGRVYSELPGGSAFESALGACEPIYWQPQPGTFIKYATRRQGNGCARAPGAPAYGTPVFVQGG